MIRRIVFPILWLWLACMILGAALGASVKAVPDNAYWPVVCATLDADPSDWSIVNLAGYMYGDGLTGREAATAIVDAVLNECPQHLDVLRSFAKRERVPHGRQVV